MRTIASLNPGSLAVLSAYDFDTGNYLPAAVELAFLMPYAKLLEKGLGFITIEGSSRSLGRGDAVINRAPSRRSAGCRSQ